MVSYTPEEFEKDLQMWITKGKTVKEAMEILIKEIKRRTLTKQLKSSQIQTYLLIKEATTSGLFCIYGGNMADIQKQLAEMLKMMREMKKNHDKKMKEEKKEKKMEKMDKEMED